MTDSTPVLTRNPEPVPAVVVRARRLLDVRTGRYLENAEVLVEGDRIRSVGPLANLGSAAKDSLSVIDLGPATLLPGLIDCHTHLVSRSAETADGYRLSLLTKSEAFRAIEGVANARATLEAGFTSVRDVENEGSGYADVALRDAIDQGLVDGPRMQVATRGIAAVGQYLPFGISPDLRGFPTGAQMVSGAEESRRAAREQIGYGADLIKVYADWRTPTLTIEELRAVVEESHRLGRKVAAHATTPEGIQNAVRCGVDSIEHGHRASAENLASMKAHGITLVPTLGVLEAYADRTRGTPDASQAQTLLEAARETVRRARDLGLPIANGYDASVVGRHGTNAVELAAMTRAGLSPLEAIQAATVHAAELMAWQDRVGALEPGKLADMVAVHGDPLAEIRALEEIRFVMKGGKVVRHLGSPSLG
ncbi:MAG TPA: amidohydrolase family protein [Thermoplasmata archaeon]|nr:amidohydrolase family protein [Thermoplasmata archaeon]